MFVINSDNSIYLTRGDVATIELFDVKVDDEIYLFKVDDVVRFTVVEKNHYDRVVLGKDVLVESETSVVDINLTSSDTRIGDVIHKPKDYWYEIELNPDTIPQTIIGHDVNGPKIFRLFPEGGDD